MERREIIYLTLRRAVELLFGCIFSSLLICALCVSGVMPVDSIQRDITLILAPVVFAIINLCFLRSCYIAVYGGKIYYIANILAYLVFALINTCSYIFLFSDLYTWLFVITRFGRYANIGISSPEAIFMFHCIVFVSIFLAPIGLRWVRIEKKEKTQRDVFEISRLEENYDNTEVAVDE